MTPSFSHGLSIDRIVQGLAIVAFLSIVIAYALYQARHLIEGPTITLLSPTNTISSERVIELTGTTQNIAFLSLNGKEIHTDESGVFREPLVLENGYTILTLAAKDRYGRETSISRPIVFAY